MKNIKLLLTGAILITFASCVNGDHYGVLEGECASMTPTTEIDVIDGMAMANYQQWMGEDVLEAYVTSSDEGGNFYKNISMVAYDALGNEYGFSVPVDQYNLYNEFEPGRKVYINLNELYYEIDGRTSSLELGFLNTNDNTDPSDDEVGRISLNRYQEKIIRSCDKMDEDDLVHHLTVTEAQDDQYLNKLIEFDAVQFTDVSLGNTYFDTSLNPFPTWTGTNHYLTDSNGNTVIVRASEFATFAGDMIPSGNGKVRGVMTKYNSDYQFMIRTINDVMLDQPRFDSNPPLVGGSLSFVSGLNEPFSTYSDYDVNFPAYINDANVGSRYWEVRSYGGNSYIQLSSYGSGEANRALFIIPVDMTAANNISFKTKDGYNNGDVLKVYYSLDYVAGDNVDDATLVDITSNFTIASGTSSGYASSFTNSGTYNIPAGITGNGYILFEYTGEDYNVTTTMQIDDIVIN